VKSANSASSIKRAQSDEEEEDMLGSRFNLLKLSKGKCFNYL
jgi:hypothetical protein